MDKNKKIFILICVVLAVLFFWIFFAEEKVNQVVSDSVNNVLPYNSVEEVVSEDEPVYTMTQEERIYTYINEIFEMLNAKKHKEIYDLLSDDFKREQFPTYSEFESFIVDYWDDDKYEPKFKKFYYKDGLFVVLTEFLKSSYTKEDLIGDFSKRFETFAITEIAENNYKFAFRDFISSRKLKIDPVTAGPLTIKLLKINKYTDTRELFFEITNNSDEYVGFSTTKMYVDANYKTPTVSYRYFDIMANETKICSIKYFMDYDEFATETDVVLYNLTLNGEDIQLRIPIIYE